MARTVTLNGTNYSVPEPSDTSYDTLLTTYLVALATAFPQLNGTNGTLTAELDLGASFGLKSLYLKSRTALPAAAGQVRLASADSINFRNNANGADVLLAKDTADNLLFGGQNVTGNPYLGANSAAGQSIPNGVVTVVVFGTVERDSDSGYNAGTGRYTIPTGKGGDYSNVGCAGFQTAPGGLCAITIYKNAVQLKVSQRTAPAANDTQVVAATMTLAAGDIIDIRVLHGNAAPQSLIAAATATYFELKRIPT